MRYRDVSHKLAAGAGVGTYTQNGRNADLLDDFGDHEQGTFGNPEAGTYGAALDQRVGGNQRNLMQQGYAVGSATLPWRFGGGTIQSGDLRANRQETAAKNAKAFADRYGSNYYNWANQQFDQGGRDNALGWKTQGELPPAATEESLGNDPTFQGLFPEAQKEFLDVRNGMAYNKQPTGNTMIG